MTTSIHPEVSLFLSFNADCVYPRQGGDVASVVEYIEVASTLQSRLETSHSSWREAALGGALQAPLLARLAFWLAAWPNADNVIAVTTILAFHMSLTEGGPNALFNAQMPRDETVGSAVEPLASSSSISSVSSDSSSSPRRSFLARLFFSTHSILGRDFPLNSLIAAARVSSLILALCGQENHDGGGGGPTLRHNQHHAILFMPGTLSLLTTIVAVTADRALDDTLTHVSASREARRALEALASLSFRHFDLLDDADGFNEAAAGIMNDVKSLVANALSVPLAASLGLSRAALTPAGAALLSEVARNSVAGLIHVYVRINEKNNARDSCGENPLFFLSFPPSDFFTTAGGGGSPPLLLASPSSPLLLPQDVTILLSLIRGLSSISSALINNHWMVSISVPRIVINATTRAATTTAICAHSQLSEHLLLALYNVYSNVDLRAGIVFAGGNVAADMMLLMRAALRVLTVQIDLAVAIAVPTNNDNYNNNNDAITTSTSRMNATLRAAHAASMILVYPLSYMPVFDHALTMLWADCDGVEILTTCLRTMADGYFAHCLGSTPLPRDSPPPLAVEWRQIFISITNVAQLMLRGGGVVRAGRGTLRVGVGGVGVGFAGPGRDNFAALLSLVTECTGLFFCGDCDLLRLRPTDAEATTLYALVGRASNFDSQAWGAYPLTRNAAGWGSQWWRAVTRHVGGDVYEWVTHPYGTVPLTWTPFIELLSAKIEDALQEPDFIQEPQQVLLLPAARAA